MPFITAFLDKSTEEGDTTYYKEVYVYDINGFSMIPLVLINDTTIPITDFYYHWYFYSEYKNFSKGQEYKLKVKHGLGEANGNVFVPADFQILEPEANFTLLQDSNLYCVWQKAANASWYFFSLDLYYSYTDTNGVTKSFSFSSDSAVYDTFLVYKRNALFPLDIRHIISGNGAINIRAMDGSTILPGARENISGEGRGFYNGANHSGERYFRIVVQGEKPLSSAKESRERLIKKLHRKFL